MKNSTPHHFLFKAKVCLSTCFLVIAALFAQRGEFARTAYAQGECSPLDIAILIDTTGSMVGAINNVKAEAADLVNQIVSVAGNDYQLALLEFRDTITVLTDLAPGTADTVRGQIAGLTATAGRGVAEASDEALNTTINRLAADGRPQSGNFTGTWRAGATKIIILITDAPPAGFDDVHNEGVDDANANQRALEASNLGIKISAVYVPTTEDLAAAEAAGINGVNDVNAQIAEAVMRNYQEVTEGYFIKTAKDGTGTARAISFTLENCDVGDLTEDFGGPAPVQVPEPITIVLFGSGLAGLAAYARRRQQA